MVASQYETADQCEDGETLKLTRSAREATMHLHASVFTTKSAVAVRFSDGSGDNGWGESAHSVTKAGMDLTGIACILSFKAYLDMSTRHVIRPKQICSIMVVDRVSKQVSSVHGVPVRGFMRKCVSRASAAENLQLSILLSFDSIKMFLRLLHSRYHLT